MSQLVAQFEMRYPSGTTIAAAFDSPTRDFYVTALFGPSGCGKTTVLRCLAGLERPRAGIITYNGETWFDAAQRAFRNPWQRDVGFLFQDYALFPHLSVADNIGYGLRQLPAAERGRRVDEMLERFQLGGLGNRSPAQISGGQQQRVALARAVARKPKLLLLDEPLAALDSNLRDELRGQLRRILAQFGIPVVVVTHDRMEAMALADQLVVMEAGRVLQSGPASRVFSHPHDAAVARIIGVETVLPGEIVALESGLATVRVGTATLLAVAPPELGKHVHVCIRGEDVTLQRAPHGDVSVRNQLPSVVKWISPEGALARVGLDCGFELTALITRNSCQQLGLTEGESITAAIKAPSIHLLPRRESS